MTGVPDTTFKMVGAIELTSLRAWDTSDEHTRTVRVELDMPNRMDFGHVVISQATSKGSRSVELVQGLQLKTLLKKLCVSFYHYNDERACHWISLTMC